MQLKIWLSKLHCRPWFNSNNVSEVHSREKKKNKKGTKSLGFGKGGGMLVGRLVFNVQRFPTASERLEVASHPWTLIRSYLQSKKWILWMRHSNILSWHKKRIKNKCIGWWGDAKVINAVYKPLGPVARNLTERCYENLEPIIYRHIHLQFI